MTSAAPGYSLAHPVYLDVPMMLSFLAHLEGGVSVSESATTTGTGARESVLKGRGGFRAKLWTLGEGDLGSNASMSMTDDTASESKTERHHTAASLFNVLYGYLREDQQITNIGKPDDLGDLRTGQLVELSGEYLGNPIEDILAFFNSLFPYMATQEPTAPSPGAEATSGGKQRRSGSPAKRAAAAQVSPTPAVAQNLDEGLRLLVRKGQDIAEAPVHDLLFRTGEGIEAVVTVASEYYSSTINEYLRAGEFRVVGKVTRVLKDEKCINLTRRTVLGAAGPDMARSIIGSIGELDVVSLDIANPIVSAPAVQILPMAIFI